jgi:hypothetical protein
MSKPSFRFTSLLFFFLIASVFTLAASCSCQGGSDDDDDDAAPVDDDSSGQTDDTFDDDSADDSGDDTSDGLLSVEITPSTRAIPQGKTKTFTATAHFADGTSSDTEDFLFASSDSDILFVSPAGEATGVAAGEATVTVSLLDKQAQASVIVGADVFYYDALGGTLGSYDRSSGTVVADYLAGAGTVAAYPLDIRIDGGKVYVVEGGDSAPGVTGTEGLTIVDLYTKSMTKLVIPDADNPGAVRIADGKAYVTSNLTDELIVVDLSSKAITRIDLPERCSPNELVVTGGKAYVACTGFSYNDFDYSDPGIVAVVDLGKKATATVQTTQVNPQYMAMTHDGAYIFVVDTGNYSDKLGYVDKIDPSSDTIVDSVELPTAPGHITITADGKAFIADTMSGSIYVLDTSDDTWLKGMDDPIALTDAFWIANVVFNPMDETVYAGDWTNEITAIINTGDYSFIAQPAMSNPGGYAFWE